nr:immunoglobulin heavy chain junction region [Mus musculus]NSM05860.1 immunoglobulin heavy chain junction region [Mus musculus]NSM08401.1 immunoglobulin heavy chain junction region [Mus musculus]NSM08791.1 immunoglobulin heavy chain junction region [Mus musculus]
CARSGYGSSYYAMDYW